jgi:hypothetical protein
MPLLLNIVPDVGDLAILKAKLSLRGGENHNFAVFLANYKVSNQASCRLCELLLYCILEAIKV